MIKVSSKKRCWFKELPCKEKSFERLSGGVRLLKTEKQKVNIDLLQKQRLWRSTWKFLSYSYPDKLFDNSPL